jgi:O-antigen/teichoic acid export membrane protein
MMVYFMIFAKNGIYFLSGNEYSGSIIPMQVIMPTLLFIGITNILGIQILIPLGKEKYVLISEIAGAIVDLTVNIILIPMMASTGAAVGTLVAEAVVLIVQLLALRTAIKELFTKIQYIKIVAAVLVGACVSLVALYFNFGDFITLVISAILFFGAYFAVLLAVKEPMTGEIFKSVYDVILRKVLHK